jgi:DNA-binding transcriptional LysR family regulator
VTWLPLMELWQLAYFVAVVEEANFTPGRRAVARGPARGERTDPAVGARVRARTSGPEWTDRARHRDGGAVLPSARAALAAVEGARLAVDELAGLVRGHFALGMITSRCYETVP